MSPRTVKRAIAFIDRNVDDLSTLLAGISPHVEPILLSDDEPAPRQMMHAVKGRADLEAIHVIAHGRPGEVSFGAGALSLDTTDEHAAELAEVGRMLRGGVIHLWTCETARGRRGAAFVEALARASGAPIAASTQRVGAAARGGRWQLDASSGATHPNAPLTAQGVASYAGVMATKDVTASATAVAVTSADQVLKIGGIDTGSMTTITSGGLVLSLSSPIFTNAGSTTTITSGGLTKGNTLTLSGTVSNVNSSVRVYDGATLLGTATFSVEDPRSWSYVTTVLPDGSHSFTVTATDNAGNTATTSAVTATVDATPPSVISVSSRVSGSVKTGEFVQITLNMSENVTVSGTPGLLLNDGGTATYASGSGTQALTFKYAVPSNQGTSDLRVIGDTLPSPTAIQDLAGNAADLSAVRTDLHWKVGSTTTAPATSMTLTGTQQMELFGPSSANVTFASGATGNLILDASSQFTGTIAGLNSAAPFDTIDLADIAFGSNTTVVYLASSADTGTLTVSDGTHTANITLLGQYSPTSFKIASDDHGGTAVVDPLLSTSGSWSGVFSWPLIGIQSLLTPDGKILSYGTDQSGLQGAYKIYDVWDPITNTHNTLPNKTFTDEFCAAAEIIPTTGDVILTGGDARPLGSVNTGVPDTNIFDYSTDSLTPNPSGPMAFARWYPTLITLDTGQLLILGGLDFSGAGVGYPEIFTPGNGWRTLTGAYIAEIANNSGWYYPRAWQASSGKVIAVAAGGSTVYAIDPSGNGQVSVVGQAPVSLDFGEPAIMFAQDRCLILGSDGSVWVMDISGPTPVFTQTGSLPPDRIWSNLTVLPDGRVMVSGGSAVDSNSNPSLSVTDADNTVAIWDPSTGLWTSTGANAAVPRLYHSTAILLPDATILSLGGGGLDPNEPSMNHLNGEIYSPGYLFDTNGAAAVRPVIQQAPLDLSPGQTFTVRVDNPANIRTLALMPFGSTTHAFNTTARRIELPFSVQADGSLSVTLPVNSDVVPPGDWMLFAIGNNGAPSIASTVQINPYLSLSSTIGTDTGSTATITSTITSSGTTKDNTLALSGTLSVAKGFGSVQVYDGTTLLGPATVSSGNWSYTTPALLDGSHSFTARAIDNTGKTTTTFAVTATVDTTPPTETISTTIITDTGATGTITSGGVTKDNTLGLSGTVSDASGVSSVQIYDGATLLGPALLTSGYTAAYAFNESSGTTTADATGHGITGTLVNGATFTTAGKYGNALALDGVNDYVDLGNPGALQLTGSMTVSAWINATAFPSDDAAVVSDRNSGNLGFQLDTTVDTGRRTIGFKLTNSSGGDMIRYGATTLQTNTWYHIAGVYDAAAQTLHVYLNGQLDDGQLLGTVTATQQPSTLDVEIGQRPGNPGAFQFNGRIDDVRIADHAITQSQIQTSMAMPIDSSSGFGNWSYTTPALLDGSHSFTAKATDNAGNTTTPSAVTATVNTGTVDTTPPVLGNVAASASYASLGPPRTLSPSATVSDVDNLNLASGTVSITGGILTGDTLAASTSGTSITASYNASIGVLSLTGSDTLAHYQQVLDSVSYSSSSQDPTNSGADPNRTISWVVNDGTLNSPTQTTTVNITASDAPPVLGNVAASASYTELASPTTLSAGTTVSDVDSPNLASGTVSITSGFLTGDTLAATVTGTSITASYNASTGVLSLTGSDTLAHYQQVLDSIAYSSTSHNPTNFGANASRTISWVVNDGTLNSAPQTTTVNITAVDDPPALGNVAASASYASLGPPTTLLPSATVRDVDNLNLASGTVSITGGILTGDTLAASTSGTSITASYNASTGVLSLTGSDTLAHYQQVLDSVSYSSSSQDPTNSGADPNRTISWVVNDGTLNSTTQTTTLTIGAAPTGIGFTLPTSFANIENGSGHLNGTNLGTFTQTGGAAGDSFTYSGSATGGGGTISVSSGGVLSASNVNGLSGGRVIPLNVTVKDTTNNTQKTVTYDIVVGTNGNNSIAVPNVASIVFGLSTGSNGTDTISAVANTAPVWIVDGGNNLSMGGSGAHSVLTGGSGSDVLIGGAGDKSDTLTGGGGADSLTGGSNVPINFVYKAVSDSTVLSPDTITNFIGSDVIDTLTLTGITAYQGQITGSAQVAAHSIAWLQSGGNTIVYANATGSAENQGSADMAIVLTGTLTLSSVNFHHAPAGVSGQAINLALPDAPGGQTNLVTVTIGGVPSGWSLNGWTKLGDDTWMIQSSNPTTLTVTPSGTFSGAMLLGVTESWSNRDGTVGSAFFGDNIEAYAPGAPVFALSSNDTLSGGSGNDLFVFAEPIGNDTIYNFNIRSDQIDLIGFNGITSFADIQSKLTKDADGNAVIAVGTGETITIRGVDSGLLSATNFLFDQEPTTNNAGSMTIGDDAILPLGGRVNNTGTIALNSTGDETDLEVLIGGATLQGGGRLILSDNSRNVVFGGDTSAVLTNIDNTISGAGRLGNGQMTLVNRGVIEATGTSPLVVDTGLNVVTNTGTIEATGSGGLVIRSAVANSGVLWADGGNLTVEAAVSGGGNAKIAGAAILEFGVGSDAATTFVAGATGTLRLDHSARFTGTVSGFAPGDMFDLADIGFGGNTSLAYIANAAGTGGTLTVGDGVHSASLSLLGQYVAAGFTAAADHGSGTVVTYVPPSADTHPIQLTNPSLA